MVWKFSKASQLALGFGVEKEGVGYLGTRLKRKLDESQSPSFCFWGPIYRVREKIVEKCDLELFCKEINIFGVWLK
jgi:hypothetical protein